MNVRRAPRVAAGGQQQFSHCLVNALIECSIRTTLSKRCPVAEAAEAVIEFDNMDGDWAPHGVIKRVLTAEMVTERILGLSKTTSRLHGVSLLAAHELTCRDSGARHASAHTTVVPARNWRILGVDGPTATTTHASRINTNCYHLGKALRH